MPRFSAVLQVHEHAGRRPIGQLTGVARRDAALGSLHRCQRLQAIQGRARAVALVLGQGHGFARNLARLLVLDLLFRRQGHDLFVEAPGLLGRGRTLLALQGIGILIGARHPVAGGHHLGRVDHRHEEIGLVLLYPGLIGIARVAPGLDQCDVLEAAGQRHRHPVHDDALRRRRDGLQSGGAMARHDETAGRHRHPGPQSRGPGDVEAGIALGDAAAENHILHRIRLDAGPRDGMAHDMAAQCDGMRHVEGAPKGLGDGCAGGRNDGGLAAGHGAFSLSQSSKVRPASASATKRSAGCQKSWASSNTRIRVKTSASPTCPAQKSGPPRQRGKP